MKALRNNLEKNTHNLKAFAKRSVFSLSPSRKCRKRPYLRLYLVSPPNSHLLQMESPEVYDNQIVFIYYSFLQITKITLITLEREASKKRQDTIRGMLPSKLKYINIYSLKRMCKRYKINLNLKLKLYNIICNI